MDMTGIDALPSGSFRLRLQYRGELLSATAATADLAVAMRDEMKRQIVDGELMPTKNSTAKHLGPRFLSTRSGNRAVSADEGRWHKRVAEARWARKPVSAITRKDGLEWLKELERAKVDYDREMHGAREAKTLSWQSRKHCLVLARRFLDWCVNEEVIAANPFAGIVVERQDGDEDEGYQDEWYLDLLEQRRLLALWDTLPGLDAKDRAEKWIVAFGLATGLREGEQWSLHLDDVHLGGAEPHVVVRYGSWDPIKERFRPPKGRKGEKRKRRVDLWGLGLEAATKWMALRPMYIAAKLAKTDARREATPPSGMSLMFPTERGSRRDRKPVRSWKTVIEAFGSVPRIGDKPWWHLLRHSCASSLVSGWWGMRWSLEDVQVVLGHSDIRTTQRYAHLAPSTLTATASRAQAAFSLAKGRHAAVTASPADRGEAYVSRHAREDSNLRPTAPEALRNAASFVESGSYDSAVTAIRYVLEDVATGRYVVSAEIVRGLTFALDEALRLYAESAGESGVAS